MKKFEFKGRTFGSLEVIEEILKSDHKYGENRRSVWLCKCVCGEELRVVGSDLNRGRRTSCGCVRPNREKYNFTDLTGKRFTSLVVQRRGEGYTKTRGARWVCVCDCGEELVLASNALTSGNNKTCGDLKLHPRPTSLVGEIPRSYINGVRQNATKRNLPYQLDDQYLYDLFLQQGGVCSLSGDTISFAPSTRRTRNFTASLDRIDSSKGYVVGNVRWVHKVINRIRWELSDADFLEWCRKCLAHARIIGEKRELD